jgi:hypothetical protein
MSRVTTDIDIDFASRDNALSSLIHIAASRDVDGETVKHQTGVYFQDIPTDPFSGLAAIHYKDAADLGYFKIDFLNYSIYEGVRDEDHLVELLNREPEWSLLEDRDIVPNFVHVGEHFGVLQRIRPKSIEDLAVVLALIRPAKRGLLLRTREEIDELVWDKDGDAYAFKRAHAIAYAASIVVQMNLLVEQMMAELENPLE